jgi:hypothetical protein
MQNLLATVAPQVIDILLPLLLTVLAWASIRLAQFIRAHTNNVRVQGVLLRLNDAVLTTVGAVEQTVVVAAKASCAGGKLSPDAAAKIKQAALDALKSHLGKRGLDEVAGIIGIDSSAFDVFLSTRIEAAVGKLPESAPVPPVPTSSTADQDSKPKPSEERPKPKS